MVARKETSRHARWALALAVGVLTAAGSAARAAPAQEPTAETASSSAALAPEEHWARGEAQFEGRWLPIAKLFEMYRRERAVLREFEQRGTAEQQRLVVLNREMAELRSAARTEEMPIRRQLAEARNRLRECNAVLRQKPPAKPKMIPLPPPPRRPASGYDSRSSSRYRSSRDGVSGWYEAARRNWQRKCDEIRRTNENRMQQYKRALDAYNAKKQEAQAEVPKLEATIKECLAKLEAIEKQHEQKGSPTKAQTEALVDRLRAHNRRVEAVRTRLEAIADALRAVPKPVLYKAGIAEFEGAFHNVAELEALARRTQEEIQRVREKLQRECEALGIAFPEGWKHPQQPRVEKIQALLAEVRKAREAAG